MSFNESYKRLEKLCNEIYGDNYGISRYIDEMINTPSGSRYVGEWDEDLKQLKHYRWVRNQIAHVPDCTEENMCELSDTQWLDDFRARLMSSNDPLTKYRNARHNIYKEQKAVPQYKEQKAVPQNYTHIQQTFDFEEPSQKAVGLRIAIACILVFIVSIIAVTAMVVIAEEFIFI